MYESSYLHVQRLTWHTNTQDSLAALHHKWRQRLAAWRHWLQGTTDTNSVWLTRFAAQSILAFSHWPIAGLKHKTNVAAVLLRVVEFKQSPTNRIAWRSTCIIYIHVVVLTITNYSKSETKLLSCQIEESQRIIRRHIFVRLLITPRCWIGFVAVTY